jgi:hypothetical protein
MIYGWLGCVFGQRWNHRVAGSNYDVTFRTINAPCKQRICSCLPSQEVRCPTSIAYRVLGSVTDAEDAVQEAWLRWSKVDPAEVSNPRAFLVRVTPRLAIDRLRRA